MLPRGSCGLRTTLEPEVWMRLTDHLDQRKKLSFMLYSAVSTMLYSWQSFLIYFRKVLKINKGKKAWRTSSLCSKTVSISALQYYTTCDKYQALFILHVILGCEYHVILVAEFFQVKNFFKSKKWAGFGGSAHFLHYWAIIGTINVCGFYVRYLYHPPPPPHHHHHFFSTDRSKTSPPFG